MLTTRVIPTLLLKQGGLVKTTRFSKPVYIGDPINAIKIFNTKEVDELIILDISASRDGRPPAFETISNITAECFMPLAYGGGIRTIENIRAILKAGVEKVVLNHAALATPDLVRAAAAEFGSQAIIVSIDVKKSLFGGFQVYSASGARVSEKDPVTSVDQEGTMSGYKLDLVETVCAAVSVPVIASGGAGSLEDFKAAKQKGASAVAAGAMFVFQGPHRAVLITYPPRDQLEAALG